MAEKNPLISVIIPVYNVEMFLPQCVDSVLGQTYKNIELILIDDGSTDTSGEMCDKYMQTDKRVKVIHQKNRGVSAARNAGLDAAQGQWVTFVDSDDWIAPDMCEKLLTAALANDAQIAMCGCTIYMLDGSVSSVILSAGSALIENEKALEYMVKQNKNFVRSVYSKLYHRSITSLLRFDKDISHGEDILFVVKALSLYGGSIGYIAEGLHHRRYRKGSLTTAPFNARRLTAIDSRERLAAHLKPIAPKFAKIASAYTIVTATRLMLHALKSGNNSYLSTIKKRTRPYFWRFIFTNSVSPKKKIQVVAVFLFPEFGYRMWKKTQGSEPQ